VTEREKELMRALLLKLGQAVGANVRNVDLSLLPSDQARAMHLFLVRVDGYLTQEERRL